MSIEAVTWALAVNLDRSTTKFVLVVIANCAHASDDLCWPSVAYLAAATCQDRKTVVENLKRLREAGFIEPTGEMRGPSKQVPVYRLIRRSVAVTASTENGSGTDPENGTGTENGQGPFFPGGSPVFPHRQSRFSPEVVPKTGHGTVMEQVSEPEGNRKKTRAARTPDLPKPDDVADTTWADWLSLRKAKKAPVTATVVAGARTEAGKAAMTLEAFLAEWCSRGSQGLKAAWLEPRTGSSTTSRGPMPTAQRDAEARRLLGFGPQTEILDA